MKILQPLALLCLASICSTAVAQDGEVVHDAEHYILLAQHAKDWARDDAAVEAVLAGFRERNGGRAPNINAFSDEALRLVRMHTEPSCTPSGSDDRLLNETCIWGVSIGNDAACWTDDFVVEQGGIVSARVGDRDLVVHYSPRYESLGVWYNDTGGPVQEIDFFGKSDRGQLTRVESLRPGMFWHVWEEFFPNTDINRGVGVSAAPGTNVKPVQEPDSDTGDLQVGSAS